MKSQDFYNNNTPEKIKLEFLLKMLALNKDLPSSKYDSFHIRIMYDILDTASQELAWECYEFLLLNKNKNLRSKPIILSKTDWRVILKDNTDKPDAVLILQSKYLPVKRFLNWAEKYKIISLSLNQEFVEKGVALGVTIDDKNQAVPLVNLNTINKIGTKFGAELLQLAKIYH